MYRLLWHTQLNLRYCFYRHQVVLRAARNKKVGRLATRFIQVRSEHSASRAQAKQRFCRCWPASSWSTRMQCAYWGAQHFTISHWPLQASCRIWGRSGGAMWPLQVTMCPSRHAAAYCWTALQGHTVAVCAVKRILLELLNFRLCCSLHQLLILVNNRTDEPACMCTLTFLSICRLASRLTLARGTSSTTWRAWSPRGERGSWSC